MGRFNFSNKQAQNASRPQAYSLSFGKDPERGVPESLGESYAYRQLKTGGNRTLVYPEEVRDAVRHRFNVDPDAGAYDRQYLHQGYHVSMEELANCPYKGASLKCRKCTA